MKKTAEDLISGHLIYVNQDEDLAKAWKTMQDNSIRHLVVVDDDYQMVGLLSDRDCLRATVSQSFVNAKGRMVESWVPDALVKEFMRSPVKTIKSVVA